MRYASAMKKFLVIFGSTVSARDQMMNVTPEQAKVGMQMWMTWLQNAGKAVVDPGSPLGDTAQVAAGKATATSSSIGGFSIYQAESRDALAALLADHPHYHAPGATIEIHEFLQFPGM